MGGFVGRISKIVERGSRVKGYMGRLNLCLWKYREGLGLRKIFHYFA